ncbi:MAG: hypothetical protein H6738_21065 [Alphaproteobacteria bacterium]|nr:hypothetical protein [Alphaproteobacteria bacterium]MCB9699285.1 hypothetical protein [Alphaproteobacteria bacterium]
MTLLDEVRSALGRARADGSLVPLTSTATRVEQDGVCFSVRRIERFEHKPLGTKEADPFRAPWTDALFVRAWPPDHALLLNKFPVLDDHLLIVTRAWADQEEPPDDGDLEALRTAMAAMAGLGFYNGGRLAGASQPHRHLQLVGREGIGELPLEPLIRDALAAGRDTVQRFRFRHRLLPELPDAAGLREVLAGLGRTDPGPHSLLAARGWALVVPRTAAKVGGIPVNSLGYAGLLATKDERGDAWLGEHGPWAVLEGAGEPLS